MKRALKSMPHQHFKSLHWQSVVLLRRLRLRKICLGKFSPKYLTSSNNYKRGNYSLQFYCILFVARQSLRLCYLRCFWVQFCLAFRLFVQFKLLWRQGAWFWKNFINLRSTARLLFSIFEKNRWKLVPWLWKILQVKSASIAWLMRKVVKSNSHSVQNIIGKEFCLRIMPTMLSHSEESERKQCLLTNVVLGEKCKFLNFLSRKEAHIMKQACKLDLKDGSNAFSCSTSMNVIISHSLQWRNTVRTTDCW